LLTETTSVAPTSVRPDSCQRGTAVSPWLRNVFRTIAAKYPGVLDGNMLVRESTDETEQISR